MRWAVPIAILVAAVGCGAGQSAPAAAPETDLAISFWDQGRERGTPKRWTLRCDPAAGTLPRRATACSKLARLAKPFAPTPKGMACTDIYGGPQQAVITGTFEGRRIWVQLSARNGCEIARWNRLKFLVGGASPGAA
jgi:hypothetical protein